MDYEVYIFGGYKIYTDFEVVVQTLTNAVILLPKQRTLKLVKAIITTSFA